MSLDKKELKYLLGELKEVFITKSEFDTIKKVIDTPPEYIQPEVVLNINPSIVYASEKTTITITPTFNQNDAGNLSRIVIEKDGDVIYDNIEIKPIKDTVDGTNTIFSLTVFYDEGIVKESLLGIPDNINNIKSGSKMVSKQIKSYHPTYYGVCDELDITKMKKILNTTKYCNIKDINITNGKFIYAYPKEFGELTSIKDANNFDYINSYTKSIQLINNVEYLVYILTDPVTIVGFKQIFS
jgi:hypothetical protein